MLGTNRRTARRITRISFAAVLLMALVGWWYATTYWTFTLDDLHLDTLGDGTDWIDVVSSIGEAAIQIFLGLAGGT